VDTIQSKPTPAPSLWGYFAMMVLAPRLTFERLMQDPRRVSLGTRAVLLVATGYTASMVLWFFLGGRSRIEPWLNIPVESYFFWEIFFIGAVTLGCWILASGVVYLLSKQAGGRGGFEDTLAMLGFAVAVPTLIPLIIDLVLGAAIAFGFAEVSSWVYAMSTPGFWMSLMLVYMLGYLIGLVLLFPIATRAAQNLPTWKALGLGLMGVVVYQGVYFIFIR
jgi:hypothetical protein